MDEEKLREACDVVSGMTQEEWAGFEAIVNGMFRERYDGILSRALDAAGYRSTRLDADTLLDRAMRGTPSVSGT